MIMGYDDWKTTEPDDDRWYYGVPCMTIGCQNDVTFPDYGEQYCTNCLVERERKSREETELANAVAERRR